MSVLRMAERPVLALDGSFLRSFLWQEDGNLQCELALGICTGCK